MPRMKTKSCPETTKQVKIKTTRNNKNVKENSNENCEAHIKPEVRSEEPSPNKSLPNLSQFKYERKPHVKIEFEKDSPIKEEGKGLWEPPNWKEFLVNLKIMRSNNDAPVDTMGCHMNMDKDVPPEVYRYQCLISLMLSSQTKDQVTFAAMERLRARGLTIDNVLAMSDEELGSLIYPVGFWKTKIKYIKATTQTLKEQYNGDIPDSAVKLCKLTGVGPKMAHICMKVAWNKITGIGVDTHVHRISNRIGWVKKPTSTPEDTRKALESWLPFEMWSEVNHLMVGFGQTICLPIGPLCHECLNSDICPSSGKGKKKTPVKSVNEKLTDTKIIKKSPKNAEISTLGETSKVPKKRKVTPKKAKDTEIVERDSNSKDLIQTENKPIKKTAPQSTKIKIEIDIGDFEDATFKINATNKQKKSPKRQLTIKDIKVEAIELDENDYQEPKTKKVTPKANKKASTKQNLNVNTGEENVPKLPAKRKSPRNKTECLK